MSTARTSGASRHLRAVSPEATPEEVAAIVAAVAEIQRRRRAAAGGDGGDAGGGRQLDHWQEAARLVHRRTGMSRGPWRLSGRLPRRSRA